MCWKATKITVRSSFKLDMTTKKLCYLNWFETREANHAGSTNSWARKPLNPLWANQRGHECPHPRVVSPEWMPSDQVLIGFRTNICPDWFLFCRISFHLCVSHFSWVSTVRVTEQTRPEEAEKQRRPLDSGLVVSADPSLATLPQRTSNGLNDATSEVAHTQKLGHWKSLNYRCWHGGCIVQPQSRHRNSMIWNVS